MLVDLARGTKADGSSLEARGGTGGRQFGSANIHNDGSISEGIIRPPSPAAQRELAKYYLLGRTVDKDYSKANDWLKKAEKAGDLEAKLLRKAMIEKGYVKK